MEDALIDALLDHDGEERYHSVHRETAELCPDDCVAVRVPDLDDREGQILRLGFAAGDAREESLQLAQGGQVWVIEDRLEVRDRAVGETLDDGFQQRLLR